MAQLIQFPGRERVINIPREIILLSRHKGDPRQLVMDVGFELLMRDQGSVVKAIESCGGDYEQALTNILQSWLDSESRPPLWDHLWQALKRVRVHLYPEHHDMRRLLKEIGEVLIWPPIT